jgi:hypothetical protein
MIFLILIVSLSGTWFIAPRVPSESLPLVIGLIFGLAALAVIVQGLTEMSAVQQKRLARAAELAAGAEPEGFPADEARRGDDTENARMGIEPGDGRRG